MKTKKKINIQKAMGLTYEEYHVKLGKLQKEYNETLESLNNKKQLKDIIKDFKILFGDDYINLTLTEIILFCNEFTKNIDMRLDFLDYLIKHLEETKKGILIFNQEIKKTKRKGTDLIKLSDLKKLQIKMMPYFNVNEESYYLVERYIFYNYNKVISKISKKNILEHIKRIITSLEYLNEAIRRELELHANKRKIEWLGTQSQLIYLFELLVKENFLSKEYNKTKWLLLSRHFYNKKGEEINHKQLSTAYQNMGINKKSDMENSILIPIDSEKIEIILERLKSI